MAPSPKLDSSRLSAMVEKLRHAGRIPGVAIGIVIRGEVVASVGFGHRDLNQQLPMDGDTVYPIASTTKSINATLLGMLVDQRKLSWDRPVQTYLPSFRLQDPLASQQVTVRDLITMRTGLPRHDWVWTDYPMDRATLVGRLRYLEASAGFRERFQYNNLTVTAAGHIAEVVTGRSWEDLVREQVLTPLGMTGTSFTAPNSGNYTVGYHENEKRELLVSRRVASAVTAPSGGAIHSSVNDMTRWLLCNLNGGRAGGEPLIKPETLREIQSPQITTTNDPSSRKPNATYALGWTVDTYNGCPRLSHGGYLHDVHSEILLFPRESIGVVSVVNLGAPMLALLIAEHVFDLVMGLPPVYSVEARIADYEQSIVRTRERLAATPRKSDTSPSHSLGSYTGTYENAGYGCIEIRLRQGELELLRGNLSLQLEHWHYDAWVATENDLFGIHLPHAFDRSSRILFETNPDGEITRLSISLEPAVSPIVFLKQ